MKISKLFHWLYAFLMFLPVFFVAGRVLYTIMNENAYQSYYGETINEKIVELVGDDVDLDTTTTYTLTISQDTDFRFSDNFSYSINVVSFESDYTTITTFYETYGISTINCNSGANYIIVRSSNTTSIEYQYFTQGYTTSISFTLNAENNSYTLGNRLSKVSYNEYSYLDNAFEYSMDSINDTELFSWAQSSFLSEPLVYITDIFGMPSTSPVITLLSYWLSISIVWLVFDLVMYIPLLVHRWIDKGILE